MTLKPILEKMLVSVIINFKMGYFGELKQYFKTVDVVSLVLLSHLETPALSLKLNGVFS